MQNLLKEIKRELREFKKNISDVTILYKGEKITDYSLLDFDYNEGYGFTNVEDLYIIIDDYTWLERESYDGLEGFTVKAHPLKSKYENQESILG